jgi:hypothetical protein
VIRSPGFKSAAAAGPPAITLPICAGVVGRQNVNPMPS